jgi:archaellum biogenesis ATPase FlaH
MEASEAVGLIIESLSSLSLQEDRLVALVEAGQVRGLTNYVKLYVGLLFYIVTSVHDYVTSEAVGLIIESLSSLSLQEDRLVALVEAGQVRGLTNCVKLYVGLLFYIVTSVHDCATSEAVGLIIESLSSLSLQEDRLVALVEAGQVSGV